MQTKYESRSQLSSPHYSRKGQALGSPEQWQRGVLINPTLTKTAKTPGCRPN